MLAQSSEKQKKKKKIWIEITLLGKTPLAKGTARSISAFSSKLSLTVPNV